MEETPTVKICLNKKYGYRAVGFAERLDIIQPSDFDDEPTLPYGLCQPDELVEDALEKK